MTTRIGEYEVTKEVLGKGQFGKVYLGFHTKTREKVAVKLIRLESRGASGATPADTARTLQEVQEMNRLKSYAHPNIIRLFDQQRNDKCLCLVLEYCEGGDVQHAIQANGPFPEDVARSIFRELVEGLCFLNEQRVLHRDIKPANIFLTSKDISKASVRIADLGLAKSYAAGSNLLQSQVGTPSYMSPERLRNEKYTFQAEVWAAGLILYEMLFGECLFKDATSYVDLMEKQKLVKNLVFPSRPAVSAEAKTLIMQMLQYDPAQRPRVQELKLSPWVSQKPQQQQVNDNGQSSAQNVARAVSTETIVVAVPSVVPSSTIRQVSPTLRPTPTGASSFDPSVFSVNPMLAPDDAAPIPETTSRTTTAGSTRQQHHTDPLAAAAPTSGSAPRRGESIKDLPPLAPTASSSLPRGLSVESGGGGAAVVVVGSAGSDRSMSPPVVAPSSAPTSHGILSRSPRYGPSPPPELQPPPNLSLSSGGSFTSSSVVFHRISVAAERAKLVMSVAAEEVLDPARAICLFCYAAIIAGRSNEPECKAIRQQSIQHAQKARQVGGALAASATTSSPQELLLSKASWLIHSMANRLLLFEQHRQLIKSSPSSASATPSDTTQDERDPMKEESQSMWAQASATYTKAAFMLEVLLEDPDISEQDREIVGTLRCRCAVFLNGSPHGAVGC